MLRDGRSWRTAMPRRDRDPPELHVEGAAHLEPAAGAPRMDGVTEIDGTVTAEPVHATASTPSLGGTAAIAQALASGAIDAATAERLLIDEAVRASLPPNSDPALVAALRAEVEAVLTGDPTIAALLQPR